MARKTSPLALLIGIGVVLVIVIAFTAAIVTSMKKDSSDVRARASGGKNMEVEPNDTREQATEAGGPNSKNVGIIRNDKDTNKKDDTPGPTDMDYWKLTLEAGKTYVISHTKDSDDAGGGNYDISIVLLSGTGTQLASGKLLSYKVPADAGGVYYIKVTSQAHVPTRYQFLIKDMTNK